MSGYWKGRATVLLAKFEISGEEMGRSTQRPSRCKSGRYAIKRQLSGNWGDPVKSCKGKERYKVAYPLKFNLMLNRGSEMFIVAIESGNSKIPESEGTLVWIGYLWKRGNTIARRGLNMCVRFACVIQSKLTNLVKGISRTVRDSGNYLEPNFACPSEKSLPLDGYTFQGGGGTTNWHGTSYGYNYRIGCDPWNAIP